jgi:hypothetical protein
MPFPACPDCLSSIAFDQKMKIPHETTDTQLLNESMSDVGGHHPATTLLLLFFFLEIKLSE